MPFLKKLSRNKWFNWVVGAMGLIAIPLLVYNLCIANQVDQIFAFVELAMVLLIFGIFIQMFEDNKPWKK